jgi:hypothetical protein
MSKKLPKKAQDACEAYWKKFWESLKNCEAEYPTIPQEVKAGYRKAIRNQYFTGLLILANNCEYAPPRSWYEVCFDDYKPTEEIP